MTDRHGFVGLPAAALVLVSSVLGIQLANGGASFEPTRTSDPCAARTVTSQSPGIDGLVERLVLLGIDGAACNLRLSREALALKLAEPGSRTDGEIDALRSGLLSAVGRMKADGTLPDASELIDEALDSMNLNGLLKIAVRALPDSLVNAALKTDDVLTRTINELDLRAVLTNLDDEDDLTQRIEAAVIPAVTDSLAARLQDLV